MISKEVLKAFAIESKGKKLTGGQGEAVLFGDIVIKPVSNSDYHEFISSVFNSLKPESYRISRPLKAKNGKYSYRGYGATRYEPGFDDENRIIEKLWISDSLHRDLAELNIDKLPFSDDPWTKAHDMLWNNKKYPGNNEIELFCNSLLDKLPEYNEELQLIHSDLGGNIMFDQELLPLVIDFSPAIAPKKFADAVIVCDSIAWGNQPFEVMNHLDSSYNKMILYAIAFRVITIANFESYGMEKLLTEWKAFKQIWDLIYK